jgi:hypothetical protein
MSLNVAEWSSNPSPLWIIALFIALSEAMAGIAAIATSGTTRLIFAIFAVAFPLLVLTIFVWLLLAHPANLYSPQQYTANTTIQKYAEVLSRERRASAVVLKEAASEASALIAVDHGAPQSDERRDEVARNIERIVEESRVKIDRSAILPGADPIEIPVTSGTTVDELLDSVYFSISGAVKPFTYNKAWVLADADRPRFDIGTQWAKSEGWQRDSRTLAAAGIAPGSTLFAMPQTASEARDGKQNQ